MDITETTKQEFFEQADDARLELDLWQEKKNDSAFIESVGGEDAFNRELLKRQKTFFSLLMPE